MSDLNECAKWCGARPLCCDAAWCFSLVCRDFILFVCWGGGAVWEGGAVTGGGGCQPASRYQEPAGPGGTPDTPASTSTPVSCLP